MQKSLAIILLLAISCCSRSQTSNKSTMQSTNHINREPAVAGQFYPGTKDALTTELIKLFAEVTGENEITGPSGNNNEIRALIVPHAGYVFSGTVAASAYNLLDPGKNYKTVFLIGSSHRTYFKGASIYNTGNYITPLGEVEVDKEIANNLIKQYPDIFCFNDEAHRQEHSLEVQLPFLQYHLEKDFNIVPVIIGGQNIKESEKIANALRPYFSSDNLFVISSDFSHYTDHEQAIQVDKHTANAIINNKPSNLVKQLKENEEKNIPGLVTSLCGWSSVLVLMNITGELQDIKYIPVLYKNSGDHPLYGEKSRVVGYYSIVISQAVAGEKKKEYKLSARDKKNLLSIARRTLNSYLTGKKIPSLNAADFSHELLIHTGAFVTLHKDGKLRGCIGSLNSNKPLIDLVQEMVITSAMHDIRFSPVKADELDDIEIEISVLTPLRKISSVNEITLGKHGIYLKKGPNAGTFLPQVATQTNWTLEEFLGHCARDKAGLAWDGWLDANICTFEAIVFHE